MADIGGKGMDRILINGGRRLNGIIPISGAKNATLPLMIAGRKLRRHDSASDVAAFSPWLDASFHAVTRLERGLPLPFGGSVLATAIRP